MLPLITGVCIAVSFELNLFFNKNLGIFSGGVGYSVDTLTPEQLVVYNQADYISTFLNLINVVCVRLCVLCLYRRLFTTKLFHRFTLGFGIFIGIHATLLMLAGAIRCVPVPAIWNPNIKASWCLNYPAGFLAGMIINALIDVILLTLPFFMIRKLQMPLRRKLALGGIFLLGAGYGSISFFFWEIRLIKFRTCIAAILRVALVYSPNANDCKFITILLFRLLIIIFFS
jgi:hypothetical protein